ncbi:MAG: YgeY family selenium metabolism-linked hydrolase [Bacteroidales bacterium]|nr:YgeY family selenium metabolism-linked hydrolase [Bacteroidales bacterium]
MANIFNKTNELSQAYINLSAENLSKLVRIESLSCNEKSVQKVLKQLMEECGADEVIIDGLGNCIGKMGNGSKVIAIDGHMDTVDVGNMNNWDFDPFSGEIKNGFVHGRGSVDQKGGVASMLTSIKILKEIGIPDNLTIYFIGSVMEEDCDGLCWKYIIEEDKIKPDVVIITEPTNLNIYRGQRGRMEIQISFQGISSHGSAPERGKNAIYLASEAALRIKDLNYNLKHDDFLGKGSITISEIKSDSPSLCAVADFAQLHIDRRLTWGETKKSAIHELEEALQGLDPKISIPYYEEEAFTGNMYGMEKYYPTWIMEENHPVITTGVITYKELFNEPPKVDKWTFSTNGVTINGIYNIPIIGFGPGDEVMAHAPNEKIPIQDLQVASAFYAAYALSI